MPAKLLAVARRPDGLRDKQRVDQNIPTLKLYYLTSGRQRLNQTSTNYDQPQKCHKINAEKIKGILYFVLKPPKKSGNLKITESIQEKSRNL